MEGLEDHQHDAARQIGERALQGEADGNARRRQHGNDGCHGNAQNADDRYDEYDIQPRLQKAEGEGPGRPLDLCEHLAFTKESHDALDQEIADNQDKQCKQDLPACGGGHCGQIGQYRIHMVCSFYIQYLFKRSQKSVF